MKVNRTYWFGRKRIGWGLGPNSWQGWATIMIYCVLMIGSTVAIDPVAHPLVGFATKIGLTVVLGVILLTKFDATRRR